jgi:hypothetical protein
VVPTSRRRVAGGGLAAQQPDSELTPPGNGPAESILVIAHGGVIKCLLYRLMGRRFLPSEPPVLLPRALHRLRHGTQGLAIEERNAVDLHSTEFLR